jgi:hypothetical protein
MVNDDIVSDWNEANLKMKRLHEAQERINYYKRDPQAFTEGKFNYEWWFKDVDVLLGEGKAKYSGDEQKKCERLKKIIEGKFNLQPPHKRIIFGTASGKTNGFKINPQEYTNVISLIESLEDVVKTYNDKHGLSTKNKGAGGLF